MKNNIDDLFKSKLKATKMPFNENDWKKMEALLDEPKKKRGILWFIIPFLVLSILGTFTFYKLNKSTDTLNGKDYHVPNLNKVSVDKIENQSIEMSDNDLTKTDKATTYTTSNSVESISTNHDKTFEKHSSLGRRGLVVYSLKGQKSPNINAVNENASKPLFTTPILNLNNALNKQDINEEGSQNTTFNNTLLNETKQNSNDWPQDDKNEETQEKRNTNTSHITKNEKPKKNNKSKRSMQNPMLITLLTGVQEQLSKNGGSASDFIIGVEALKKINKKTQFGVGLAYQSRGGFSMFEHQINGRDSFNYTQADIETNKLYYLELPISMYYSLSSKAAFGLGMSPMFNIASYSNVSATTYNMGIASTPETRNSYGASKLVNPFVMNIHMGFKYTFRRGTAIGVRMVNGLTAPLHNRAILNQDFRVQVVVNIPLFKVQ